MNPHLKMISAYGRIWFIASFINSLLSTLIIMSDSWTNVDGAVNAIGLILGCSLLFAMPGILISILITAIILSYTKKINLFRMVLTISFFASLLTAICFIEIMEEDIKMMFLAIPVIISAIIAVFINRNYLREPIISEE